MYWGDLLAYPDFNEWFKIHTNTIYLQLVLVIRNKGKPIAFHSRKLTDARKICTVTEKDLLSIVETLKEFRTILLSQILLIYTDNGNFRCKDLVLIEY